MDVLYTYVIKMNILYCLPLFLSLYFCFFLFPSVSFPLCLPVSSFPSLYFFLFSSSLPLSLPALAIFLYPSRLWSFSFFLLLFSFILIFKYFVRKKQYTNDFNDFKEHNHIEKNAFESLAERSELVYIIIIWHLIRYVTSWNVISRKLILFGWYYYVNFL